MLTLITSTGKRFTADSFRELKNRIGFMTGFIRCDGCEAAVINGLLCHETGCPHSWRDEKRVCLWCGQGFHPDEKHDVCCSPCCYAVYNGRSCDCAECRALDEDAETPSLAISGAP